jgi:hypothetical protein
MVRSLQSRLLTLELILKATVETLKRLGVFCERLCNAPGCEPCTSTVVQDYLENLKEEITSYKDDVIFLMNKSQMTTQSVTDIMNTKYQAISEQQSNGMWALTHATRKDSVSIRVITVVTLFYLPFSFIAVS